MIWLAPAYQALALPICCGARTNPDALKLNGVGLRSSCEENPQDKGVGGPQSRRRVDAGAVSL
jgi:hypothetical protein